MIRLLVKIAVWVGGVIVGLAVLVGVVIGLATRAEKQRLADARVAAKTDAAVQAQRAEDAAKREADRKADAEQAEKNRTAIVDALVSKFNPSPSGWASFEVSKADLTGIGQVSASLYYDQDPSGYSQVEEDTKQVVRAILEWVQSTGRDPTTQSTLITVRAKKKEVGETGKELIRIYGRSVYDFNRDQITFTKDE